MGIAVIGIAIGYVLVYPEQLGICQFDSIGDCVMPYADTVGRPLLVGLTPLVGFLFFLLFMPAQLCYRWMFFALAFLPVGLFFILIADPHGGVYSYNIDTQFMVWLVAGFFLIASFGMTLFHIITQKQK